jgi:hypothetical protein
MTSQPGTRGHGRTPEDVGHPRRGRRSGARPRPASDQPWPLVLPLMLLIILGLAGLRGAPNAPRWNGPLRHDGLAIGLVLEAIFAALLVLATRRRSREMRAAMLSGVPVSGVPAKLRGVLIFVLGAGMIAVAVATVLSFHLHWSAVAPPRPHFGVKPSVKPRLKLRPGGSGSSFQVPLGIILYVLLVVALVAAVVLSVWWSRRYRLSFGTRGDGYVAEDPEDLREAVESGRAALRAVDDARAAIIACYVAMESSLAERGTARAVADTPDELLARATTSGLVRGTAAARLTALFYEARFSSHPLGREQRDAAEQALDELAVALAARTEPMEAGAGP